MNRNLIPQLLVLSTAIFLAESINAIGQDNPPLLSAFNQGNQIAPASYTVASRRLQHGPIGRPQSQERQIQIEIKFLVVDDATRDVLYQGMNHPQVITAFFDVEKSGELLPLPQSPSSRQSMDRLLVPSYVTTTTLQPERFQSLLEHIQNEPRSGVRSAPNLILIDGQVAEVKDLVQRPFMVNANYIAGGNGEGTEPIVKVCDEGTTISVRASLVDSGRIQLSTRIISQELVDVRHAAIYGIGPEKTHVQIPIEHVQAVSASQTLTQGDVLLVDPYVSVKNTIQKDSEIPVLSRLPLVGTSFVKSDTEEIQRHLLFTFRPLIHREFPVSKKQSAKDDAPSRSPAN